MNSFLSSGNKVLESCTSTNDILKELALLGAPHGTWVASQKQTAGRGQFEKKWISPEGQLFLSILIRKIELSKATWIPLITGICLCEILNSFFKLNEKIQIKWPNDLVFKRKKLSGILCEGNIKNNFIILGIGINLKKIKSVKTSISLEEITKKEITLEYIREEIIQKITERIDYYINKKTDYLHNFYFIHSALPLKSIWKNPMGESFSIEGLSQTGELMIRTEKGEGKRLSSSQEPWIQDFYL